LEPTLEYSTWSISESNNIIQLRSTAHNRYHHGSVGTCVDDGRGIDHLSVIETLVKLYPGVQCIPTRLLELTLKSTLGAIVVSITQKWYLSQ
jgi:hypothetical protein